MKHLPRTAEDRNRCYRSDSCYNSCSYHRGYSRCERCQVDQG